MSSAQRGCYKNLWSEIEVGPASFNPFFLASGNIVSCAIKNKKLRPKDSGLPLISAELL